MPPSVPDHPCLRCGACCAAFRVDFAAGELDALGGSVPAGLAVAVKASPWRIRGTDHQPVGGAPLTRPHRERAGGGIYEWRPNPCRELAPGSDACARARARHGLPPLPAEML